MADINNIPWKYLDDFRGTEFTGEWPTFPELLRIQTKRNGDRPCFTAFDGPGDSKRTLTYSEVLANVSALATWLTANGLKKGDRVAVMGKNSPEWATAYLATLYASGIVVPVDNGLHEPGEMLVHYGAHLLQCPNGSNNFHSRDEMLVEDKNNAILPICTKSAGYSESEKNTGFSEGPGYFLQVNENSSAVCFIRPFTGLDYSEIKLEGKKIVIHGTYHSESVCIGRSIYTVDEEVKPGEDEKNSRDDYRLDEILEKDRNYSILYLLDKCAGNNIPVFLAPCDKKAAAYGTTKNATGMGAKTLKGITLEAAYAKAVLGCFLGIQADSLNDFMSKPINDEKSEEDPD